MCQLGGDTEVGCVRVLVLCERNGADDVPSLTLPEAERRTLAALMSRWILLSPSWRYSRPRRSSRRTMAMCVSLNGPGFNYEQQVHCQPFTFKVSVVLYSPDQDKILQQDIP